MAPYTSFLIALVLLAAFAQPATADRIKVTGHTDYRDGVGGEFNVKAYDLAGKTLLENALSADYTVVNGTTVGTANGTSMNPGFLGLLGFQTFCIEYNEHISLDGIYEAAISDGSINGGAGGGVDPDGPGGLPPTDKISIGTAYLYTMFATGTLSDYTYANGSSRAQSAEKLQQAFWYLEDEVSLTAAQKSANTFLTGAAGALTLFGDGVLGAKKHNDFSLYHVRVLNLWGLDGTRKQDQLIMVAPPVTVPDGATAGMLLGFALTALAGLRRKSD
jgi:hypothetical protein